MAANKRFKTVLEFIRLPVLTGLAVAGLLLLIFPEFRGSDHSTNQETVELGLAGPVSYAQAVKKAAPSVVNIYTKTQD